MDSVFRYPHIRFIALILVLFSVLYGTSYQQFRLFDVERPEGTDAPSYIKMSHGDYDVPPIHRYRFVVPGLASIVRMGLRSVLPSHPVLDKLSFYIVNFTFVLAAAVVFFFVLDAFGFSFLMCLLGAMIFLSSRITIISAATPNTDSLYLFSICLLVFLTLTERRVALSAVCPFLIFSKETILPVLFLPLLFPKTRKIYYGISIMASLLLYFFVRSYWIPSSDENASSSLFAIVYSHATDIFANLGSLFTLQGLHSIQNGYSLFVVFAILGYKFREQVSNIRIPAQLLLLIPLALLYAFMSGNLGRLFYLTSFVVVIPFALIGLIYTFGPKAKSISGL